MDAENQKICGLKFHALLWHHYIKYIIYTEVIFDNLSHSIILNVVRHVLPPSELECSNSA